MTDTVLAGITLNNKYQIISKIGAGSYGIVYLAKHLYTNKVYAIKAILKKQHSSNQDENKRLLAELEDELVFLSSNSGSAYDETETRNITNNLLNLELIQKFGYNCKILKEISLQLKIHRHPNILSIYKVYDNPLCLFVVMDYYKEGDLFQNIVDKKLYQNNPNLVKSVFLQLIDAISYCHANSVYHCDLKPENILVSENGAKLIIADFGLALQEEYISSSISCGSSYYMAPERIDYYQSTTSLVEEKIPTRAGDVWSLAIILINLISIRNPWLKASVKDNTFAAYLKDATILTKILPLSQEIFDLLANKYLVIDPFKRHSLLELRHDIIHVKKLSSSGPLSINCQELSELETEEEVFLQNSCQIPFDHIVNNKSAEHHHVSGGHHTTRAPLVTLPPNHPIISHHHHIGLLDQTFSSSASASASAGSCPSDDDDDMYDDDYDDEMMTVQTPPTTYPSSPVLINSYTPHDNHNHHQHNDTTQHKKMNLDKMLNHINDKISSINTTTTTTTQTTCPVVVTTGGHI